MKTAWSSPLILVLLGGIVATALMVIGAPPATAWLGVGVLASLAYLAVKGEGYRRRSGALHRQQAAYEQLDQQAKLIIRTDVELHRTQEELDRRIASLMSLYELSRQLRVTLRPDEVFGTLDPSLVTNFGFSQGLLGMCRSFDAIEWRSLVGVNAHTAEAIKQHLLEHQLLKPLLAHPSPLRLEATSADPAQQQLLERLGDSTAVVAGVLPHAGPAGCLILGCVSGGPNSARVDEELIAILTNQLATAVENSALYEETFRTQQELERKVHERTHELAQANAALVRLNKAKSDFVSAVSHELRTPLAAIKGYASLLGSGQFGTFTGAQTERLTKIEKHADLLTQLINNLLDIARIESGRTVMERQPFLLEEFLTTTYDMVRPQLEAKHLRYTVDLDGVRQLVGDAQHLQRVFVNLLSNAVKYTPEGGEVRLRFRAEGDAIVAAVSDTGCGIDHEELPNLFQEFYRSTDPINQQIRGTGLGLALAKRIVEAHHGRIWVTSQRGKGSTFSLQLPAGR